MVYKSILWESIPKVLVLKGSIKVLHIMKDIGG
jgi:hypothetical protein